MSNPRQNHLINWRQEGKEALLYNPQDGRTFILNETGFLIWKLCDGGHSVDDIVSVLLSKYETSKEKAAADANTILLDLQRKGCISM